MPSNDASHLTLLLTSIGRRSGEPRTTPVIYGQRGDDYLVVASNDGSDTPPAWYFNLTERRALLRPEDVGLPASGRRRGLGPRFTGRSSRRRS